MARTRRGWRPIREGRGAAIDEDAERLADWTKARNCYWRGRGEVLLLKERVWEVLGPDIDASF